MQAVKVYQKIPKGFVSEIEVVVCYLEWKDKILFLKRAPEKIQGGLWGVPGGKLEKGESREKGLSRELQEELSLYFSFDDFISITSLAVSYPNLDFFFHMYRLLLETKPRVNLSNEHTEYKWLTIDQALELALVLGERETFQFYIDKK